MRRHPRLAAPCAVLALLACGAGCAQGAAADGTLDPSDPCSGATAAGEPSAAPACACAPSAPAAAATEDAQAPGSAEGNAGASTDAGADSGVNLGALLSLVGGSGSSSAVRSDPDPVLCPGSYTCQSLDNFPVCIGQGSSLPPSCSTNADCTSAGLPGVPCVDLSGAVGLPLVVCLKLCNSS